ANPPASMLALAPEPKLIVSAAVIVTEADVPSTARLPPPTLSVSIEPMIAAASDAPMITAVLPAPARVTAAELALTVLAGPAQPPAPGAPPTAPVPPPPVAATLAERPLRLTVTLLAFSASPAPVTKIAAPARLLTRVRLSLALSVTGSANPPASMLALAPE